MNRSRNIMEAMALLDRLEASFARQPGGAASAAAREQADRWLYELSVCSNDPFCREKASFLLAYSEDYFSDTRHAKYGVGAAPGLSVLRERIFGTIGAIRKRLERMDRGGSPPWPESRNSRSA